MTEPRSDLLAATRLLVQWGRARQTAWHDPSRDLLAALGNRHASFSDFSDHRPDEPPTPDWRATPQRAASADTTPPPPPVATESPAALVGRPAPHDPSPAGAVSPAPASESRSGHHVATPPIAAAPVTIAPPPARRRRTLAVALAAALVLAVVAVPTVWRSFSSSRAPVAPPPSRVVIDSTPAGSVVFVDNVERGKTPLVIELPAGMYRVQLRYRKNVRTFDLEVVAGMPAEATVDWTKKPVIKRKAPPQKNPDTKTAAVASQPAATAQAATQRVPTPSHETTSQAVTPSEGSPDPPPSSEQPAEAESAR